MEVNEDRTEKNSDFMSNLCTVMTKIYTSCDPLGTNNVKVSELVNYIKPYMHEDLSALDCLRNSLDPNNLDICVSSRTFYDAMNEWAKKMSHSDDEDSFNRTPSQLDFIDEKELPYRQSTPRASFGQKLLNHSMDILNISNVSTYGTNGNRTTAADVASLEEKIHMQQHEIHKCKNDLATMKLQLSLFEDQNETLQADLNKANKKLRSEQLLVEHLQKQISEQEDIKEEISTYRKKIDVLTKKNTTAEREYERLMSKIDQLEQQKEKMETKCDEISKREQEAKKQIFDVKLEMDMKEISIADLMQMIESYKNELNEKKDLIDYLKVEIEQLTNQNTSLNRALKDKRLYRNCSLAQTEYNTILDGSSMAIYQNVSSPLVADQNTDLQAQGDNSPCVSPVTPTAAPSLRKMVLTKAASTPTKGKFFSPGGTIGQGDESDDSYTKHMELMKQYAAMDSLQDEMSRVNDICQCNCEQALNERDQIMKHREKYESDLQKLDSKHKEAQENIKQMEKDNRELKEEINHVRKQREELENRLKFLGQAKQNLEERLASVQADKDTLSWELKDLLHVREDLERHLQQLAQNKIELESQLASVQSEKKVLMQDLRRSELQFIEVKKDLQLNVEKVTELKDRCKILSQNETKLETIKASLAEKEKLINELNNTIKSNSEWKKMLQDQLHGEVQEKSVKIRTLNEENNELKKKLDELKSELDEAVSNKIELHDINRRVQETTSQIEEHLNQKTLLVAELQKINGRLSESVQQMEIDVQAKMAQIITLQNDMKNDIDTKNDLFDELKKMKTENLKLAEEHKALKEQKNEYNEILVDYNKCKLDFETLKEQVDKDNIKYKDLYKQNDDLLKKVGDKEVIVQNQERLIRFLEKRIEEEQQKNLTVRKLEIDLKEKVKKIGNLESCKLKYSETIVFLKKEIAEKCEEIGRLLQENDKINISLDGIIGKLGEHLKVQRTEDHVQDLNNFVDMLLNHKMQDENNMNQLIIKLSESLTPKEELTGPFIEKVEKLLELLKDQHAEDLKIIENLQTKLHNAQSISDAKPTFSKHLVTIDRLQSRIELLEQKMDLEKRRSEKFAIEIDKLRSLNKKLNSQLVEVKEDTDNLKGANKKLRDENSFLEEKVQILNSEISDCKHLQLNCTLEENNKCFIDRLAELETVVEVLKEEKGLVIASEEILKEQLISKDQIIQKLYEDLDKFEVESQAIQENEERLKGIVGLLKSTEMELKLTKSKVDKSKEELERFDDELKGKTGVLACERQELAKITVRALKMFRKHEDFAISQGEEYVKLFKEVENESFQDCGGNSEGELQKLVKQLKVATILLEIVTIKLPNHVEVPEDCYNFNKSLSRMDQPETTKLSLIPSRLLMSRPESPDSPSLDLWESSKELINLEYDVPKSPDSDAKTLDALLHRYRLDGRVVSADEGSLLQNEDDLCFCSEFELVRPFPHITDTFLEKLGLHETSELKKLTKEETERLFTTLVIQLSIDSNDYKDRRLKHKEQLSQLQEELCKNIKEIMFRLRDPTNSVKILLLLIEELKLSVEKVIGSAAQYGVVSYEGRMMKCWNLVTNYTAMLRRENDLSTSPSTRESPTQTPNAINQTPRHRLTKGGDSIRDIAVMTQDSKTVSRTPKRALLMMSVITAFAIFMFLSSFVHLHCRMVSSDEQPCPLDFIMQRSVLGPPPF